MKFVNFCQEKQEFFFDQKNLPSVGSHEVLVRIHATAVNRADLLQVKGKYPPPEGASDILGLECSGEIEAVGGQVKSWRPGERVMALLQGGGYASHCIVHESLLMPVPDSLSFEEAAAVPEVFLTAYQALFFLAELKKGERLLVHAGASGVGSACIQLAKDAGASIFVTASSAKQQACNELGASVCIDYQKEDFYERITEETLGEGVDVIVDCIGASYFERNVKALSMDGRMVMLAFLGGIKVPSANLLPVVSKRLKIIGSTLRARNLAYRSSLTQAFWSYAGAKFQSGALQPVVHKVLDWEQAANAHCILRENQNVGKVVLRVRY
ncbi:MAG: NAD(P)H-quinone oxidoreductase [Cytophagales bacterium]|nr:NAD(P)H-quinone oxidoreductase [Cytophagales bacterium]